MKQLYNFPTDSKIPKNIKIPHIAQKVQKFCLLIDRKYDQAISY